MLLFEQAIMHSMTETDDNAVAIATGKTKVKPTSKGGRVWLEGTKLGKAGFSNGTAYTVTYYTGYITLSVDALGSRKVAGKLERPIIDLQSKAVYDSLGVDSEARIDVEYFTGLIIISNKEM